MTKKRFFIIGVLLLLVFTVVACNNQEDTSVDEGNKVEVSEEIKFPEKAMNLIIPYAPGGSSDLSARPVAEFIGETLGKPVVVINRPGAGGSIAAAEVAKSKADGYTLLNGSNGNLEILPYTKDIGYEVTDFKPVARTVTAGLTVAVSKDSPFETLQDLIDYAKENPGKLKCGTPGTAGLHHLTLEAFKDAADIDIVHVPFEGANLAMAGLLGGHIDMTTSTTVEVSGHYESGEMKILATSQASSTDRLEKMPDVPSFTELGLDIMLGTWYGILAPKDTPDEVVNIISAEIKKAMEDPKVIKACESLTLTPDYLSPEELEAQMKKNTDVNRRILEKIGLAK